MVVAVGTAAAAMPTREGCGVVVARATAWSVEAASAVGGAMAAVSLAAAAQKERVVTETLAEGRRAAMPSARGMVQARSEADRMVGATVGSATLLAVAVSPAEAKEAASAAEAAERVAKAATLVVRRASTRADDRRRPERART